MWRAVTAFLLMSLPATAQEPPACTPARAGAVACMAGKLCECRFDRGGSITGQWEGMRWDCGILRPPCGEALAPPGIGPAPWMPMPELLLQLPGAEPPRSPWAR